MQRAWLDADARAAAAAELVREARALSGLEADHLQAEVRLARAALERTTRRLLGSERSVRLVLVIQRRSPRPIRCATRRARSRRRAAGSRTRRGRARNRRCSSGASSLISRDSSSSAPNSPPVSNHSTSRSSRIDACLAIACREVREHAAAQVASHANVERHAAVAAEYVDAGSLRQIVGEIRGQPRRQPRLANLDRDRLVEPRPTRTRFKGMQQRGQHPGVTERAMPCVAARARDARSAHRGCDRAPPERARATTAQCRAWAR